jgi:carbonic anhydrase
VKPLSHLFEANARWAAQTAAEEPDFFPTLAAIQRPDYLWIGCSDSRVPANQITGLKPGEVFVHRNVANVVVHTDLNCLSVVQYAIDVLGVPHIMVVGHYGCGGIRAALDGESLGLIDNWLRHIQDVADRHAAIMDVQPDIDARWRALCELNVIEQVRNLGRSTLVGDAWRRGQDLTLHGWVYGLEDGRLLDLDISSGTTEELDAAYRRAITEVTDRYPAAK